MSSTILKLMLLLGIIGHACNMAAMASMLVWLVLI